MLLLLLAACGHPDQRSPCTDWRYEPVGPTASAVCECDSSEVLFYCDEDTCAGPAGQTTCEPEAAVGWVYEACVTCRLDFTDASAFRLSCP